MIKQLLVYASQVRLNGYTSVPLDYYMDAYEYFHDSLSGIKTTKRTFQKYIYSSNGGGSIFMEGFLDELCTTSTRYAENVDKVDSLYMRAQLSDNYNELAFQLFLMGIVNPHKYLSTFKDVEYIISHFDIRRKYFHSSNSGILNLMPLNYAPYKRLMSTYIENMSRGIDYGYPVWDFVYGYTDLTLSIPVHLWKRNHYFDLIKSACGLDIQDYSIFNLSESTLKKYTQEISIFFPKIADYILEKYGRETTKRVFMYLLSRADLYLYRALLSDPWILDSINSEGIEIK